VIEENDYVNAIQYCFTQGNYKYYITYDCDENSIDLIVNRKNGSAEEQIILTINIGGVNGNNTIVKELKIVLSNCPISSQFEDSSDVTVYAGDLIYLSDKINKDNANITYSLKEGDYTVNGKAITLSSDDVDNALFTFNDNKTIQTKAVGANTRARIVLIAYLNGYAIKEVIYNFVVKLNLQFIVNDGELVQGADTETNFVLTTTSSHNTLTSGGFPITVDFIANTKVVKTGQYANVEGEYYNVLACDLYNLVIQGNENASKNELLIQGKGFNIELYSNISNKILEVSNSGIVFQQDYCGDVELKLSVPTANGTYSVIWTIHVSGIKNQSYASKDANYARLQINSMPFNSGDIVNIFNTQTGSGVGVIMNNPLYFAINDTNIKMTFTYEYVINALNQETSLKTNEALFTNSDSNKKGSGDGYKDLDITKNVLSITLPSVPTTSIDAQQSYFVTYKIYATYLGLNAETAQVFYVTYRVINYQQLETLSADINVDNLTKLGLFYFDENYKTTSGIDYKFTYEKPNIMLNGTICSIEDVNGNIKIKFSSGYYDVNDNIIYDNSNVEIKGGTWSSTSEKEGETVFRSKFANIYEYKKFIDAVSVQIGESNKYVFDNLSNFGNGIYGIDLSSKFTGNNKFENELCADFKLMENRVATYTVPAYSIENKNGFRLTTSNKITANTKDGDQEGIKLSAMFLPSYFEPNAAIANNPVTLNTPIIGVGDPSASWVNKGSANTDDSTEYATITIPGGVEYTVKKVVYSDGSGTLYKLEREYYYIKESTVVVPDYRAVGIETTFFNVVYQYGNTNQTLDLDKGFKVWTMKDMGEGKKRLTSNEVEKIISSDDLNCDISEPSLKRDGDMIKINSSALMNYKKQYPNKSQYPTVKAEIKLTANASVFTFECDIKFALPQYVTVGATFNDATTDGLTVEDLTVSLIDQIYIPVKVGTAVEYNLLDSLNVSKITSIYESEYLKSYKDGELIFDSQKIKLYFDETAKEELRILCELSTQDGVLEFEVVVEDTRST